jgi:LacI family transcriptional regulator
LVRNGEELVTSLRDLASVLGVSTSTASRALNGYADVSPATRQRVESAAREMGYRPDPRAHRLATGRAGAVALVGSMSTRNFLDATFAAVLSGVDTVLRRHGLYTLATSLPTGAEELPAFRRLLDGRLVDAVIVARTHVRDPRVNLLLEKGLPFVTYGRTARSDEHAWVDPDNELAFQQATQHLLERGHRAVHFINGPSTYMFAQLREKGWRGALAEYGAGGHVRHAELTSTAGHEAARELLASGDTTALLCANDTLAIGAMAAVRDAGRKVGAPDGVAVVGYGNTEAGRYAEPPLTTIDYSIEENGRHLGECLVELLAGRPPRELQRLESVRLMERASSSAFPFPTP